MRIHYLQHVPFEKLENIERWAQLHHHAVSGTLMYEDHHLPSPSELDMVVILGGPMGAHDEEKYPWLKEEKQFIRKVIDQQKLVLGICLGAQLIADVLGGKVYPNQHKELGWHSISLSEKAKHSPIFHNLPNQFVAFHWHGDTFSLPEGISTIASSDGCQNQAFIFQDHVIGLQFHLESSIQSIQNLIHHCSTDIEDGLYIQKPAEMLNQSSFYIDDNTDLLFTLLNNLETVMKEHIR